MSFAFVAVILLLVAGVSTAVLASFRQQEQETLDSEAYIDGMRQCADGEGVSIRKEAYSLAVKVASENPTGNESALIQQFSAAWNERLSALYPKQSGPYLLRVDSDQTSLSFLRLSAEELPQFEADGGKATGSLDATIPAFVTIAGPITFNVSCDRGFILRGVETDVRIYSPIPLLQNRFDAFLSAIRDDNGHLQNVVRYELSALVQKRALEGKDLFGPMQSGELLSNGDVEKAVTLAFIIEQERLFRNYDWESGHAALARIAVSEEALAETERILGSDCTIDPAELFLNLIGEGNVDLRIIVAQSLYAATDALVLKWLDYLQVADIAEFLEKQMDRLAITVSNVLNALFGYDPVNELALDWVRDRMGSAGYSEDYYRYLCTGSPDAYVEISGPRIVYTDSAGEDVVIEVDGTWAVDFPTVDLFDTDQWKTFFVNYKTSTFEMAEMLEQLIKSVAINVADCLTPSDCEIAFDPTDGGGFIEELTLSVDRCLEEASASISNAFECCASNRGIKDGMALALVRFIESRWLDIFQVNSTVGSAIYELAHNIACSRLPWLGSADVEAAADEILFALENGNTNGVRDAVQEAYCGIARERVETFVNVFDKVTLSGAAVAFAEAIARLAVGLVQAVPGVDQVVKNICERMMNDLSAGSTIRGDELSVPIRGLGPLRLDVGNGESLDVELKPVINLDSIRGSNFATDITYPEQYPAGTEGYPNLHVTDIFNLTLCPFQSQFGVDYVGNIEFSLGCDKGIAGIISEGLVLSSNAPFAAHFTLFTSSGWPLQGVEYSPTMTLVKQIAQALQAIWDGIVGALKWVWDGLNTVVRWITDAISTALSWAMKLVEYLADLLAKVIQGLKDLIGGAFGAFAEWIGETVSTSLGKVNIAFSFFGISWLIETNPAGIPYGRSRDYLKVTGSFNLCGVDLSGTMRIANVHDKGTDVLFNGTASGEDWAVRASIDPLMLVTDRFLAVVGSFSDFVIELSMPKVIQYNRIAFSLADVPAIGQLLSRIPLPIPGMTGSLNAGFELMFNSPIDDHIVINEVELNPPSPDAGREWVELYNPLGHAVSLSGWCFSTKHGVQSQSCLPDEVIPAKGWYVHVFERLTLDNGGESGLPLGESVSLIDPSGNVVDSTPFFTDYYNDDRTWQRRSDGTDNWVFKDSTMGGPNSAYAKPLNDFQVMLRELGDAALRGMAKVHANGSFGIDTLANLVRCTVEEVVRTVIEEVGDAIVEAGLFVELRLQDCSQSVGGTIRLSLSVTGDFVKEGLRWIADAVRSAFGSFGNPSAVSPRSHSADKLADDVWIKFGAYVDIGLPRILGAVSAERFSFGGEAHINLASFIPSGSEHQNWSIAFGALFKSVPGKYLDACLNVDANKLVDCWLIYATIHAPGFGTDSV